MSRFEVIGPASELSLLTVSELRAAAGVSDGSRDAELLSLGRRLSTSLARACNVVADAAHEPTLLQETCTETLRWSGCGPIDLSRRPITSVVSVTIDGGEIDPSGYEIGSGRLLYRLSSGEPTDWSAGRIVVEYVAGYAVVPGDLKLAASKLCTSLAAETARDPSLKRVEIPGVMTKEYWVGPSDDPLLSKEIDDLIVPYVQRWV